MIDVTLQGQPATAPVRSLGKRMGSTALYALVAALMLVTPLLVFLPAVLLHCGIRNGRRAAWVLLPLAAALALVLLLPGAMSPQATPAMAYGSYAFLIGLVLAVGVPALVVLPMVERGERFGRVLAIALLVGLGGLLATELVMRIAASFSPLAAHVAAARDTASQFLAAYAKAGVPTDAIRFLRKWMNIGVFVLPAFLLIDVAVVFILSLVTLVRMPAWKRFAQERGLAAPAPYLFRNLALPEWVLFAFVLGGLAPLLSGMPQRISANMLAVVAFLYLLQGLSLFRAFLAGIGAGFGATLFAYGLLGLLTMTGIAPLLLSVAGLFDSFFDFRHFNRKDHSDESHSH
jgi:Predicted membrane protein (DUF2232)